MRDERRRRWAWGLMFVLWFAVGGCGLAGAVGGGMRDYAEEKPVVGDGGLIDTDPESGAIEVATVPEASAWGLGLIFAGITGGIAYLSGTKKGGQNAT